MHVIMIHGAYGSPGENWFPWLKSELEKQGHEVSIPQFPTPEGQTPDAWLGVMKRFKLDENTILIGHSVGATFILSMLEKSKVKAAILVAGFCSPLGNKFDKINDSFYKDFNWQKIRANCNEFVVINSDNDPYVPLKNAKKLADSLGVKLVQVKGAGHFNADAGYRMFPELLQYI
jgi:predicted alpha/beta hydrolase family esterase